eukprot:TRINITY_DN15564_c0_g1_i1.p1 TRINITY_DN15564_c0_g1~~TRINITY_DN15564_c0_g1_i1.p1  ORF type:complete len:425 (+),score=107.65 TRINITY_DN15564_c0_g1_i1:373-1647(+)
MDDVKLALRRTLGLRFRLGLFDPIESQPYWHVGFDEVNTTASQATNLRMTQETMVLLKNDQSTLPFNKAAKTVAVIGPHYNARAELVGNYLGEICPGNNFDCIISPATAIASKLSDGEVITAAGCKLTSNSSDLFQEAIAAAKKADVIVLAMGIGQSIEGESHDRTDVDLPVVQHQLVAAIRAACPNTPTAMFLLNGGMVAIEAEKQTVPAILESFYPGFWGGQAIADTLFGDNQHLGGKLPFTIYPVDYINSVKMSDMSMSPSNSTGSPGRSYRYYTGAPTYPFGYGIGLTTFKLQNSSAPENPLAECADLQIASYNVTVTNTGNTTGDQVVLAFFKPSEIAGSQLIRQLFGFERVHLAPGQSATVSFGVAPTHLQLVDQVSGDQVCMPGEYELEFTDGVAESLFHTVTIQGPKAVIEPFPRF